MEVDGVPLRQGELSKYAAQAPTQRACPLPCTDCASVSASDRAPLPQVQWQCRHACQWLAHIYAHACSEPQCSCPPTLGNCPTVRYACIWRVCIDSRHTHATDDLFVCVRASRPGHRACSTHSAAWRRSTPPRSPRWRPAPVNARWIPANSRTRCALPVGSTHPRAPFPHTACARLRQREERCAWHAKRDSAGALCQRDMHGHARFFLYTHAPYPMPARAGRRLRTQEC